MIKNLLRKFLTYGTGSILQTALKFIFLPLYLRYFSPAEYGVISVLTVVLSLVVLLTTGGVMSAMIRLYYEAAEKKRRELVGATWFWYLLMAALGGLILSTQAPPLSDLFFQTPIYQNLVRLLGVIFIFSLLQQIPFTIFRLEGQAGRFVAFSLFNFLADFILKLYFIVWLERGIQGYFESGILANLLTLGVLIPFVSGYIRLSFNFSMLQQLFRLGFPYIFTGLSAWTLEVSDRLLLSRFSGEDAVGIYSLAYSLANMFGIFLAAPVALLMPPFFFKYATERSIADTRNLLRRSLIYFFLAGGILYLAISLGSGELLRGLTLYFGAKENYLEAARLVPILTIAPLIYFLSTQAELAGLTVKKPEIASLAFMIAAGINFGLNLVIIPRFGALGAAITTAIAYLIMGIVFYIGIEKVFPVDHDWKALTRALLYLVVAFVLGWSVKLDLPFVSLLFKVVVAVLTFITLILFTDRIMKRSERTILFTYLLNGRKRLSALWHKF
jgi:O-antigen/teichoic acid export membrane protein